MMRRVIVGVLVLSLLVAGATAGLAYWLVAGDGTRIALERQATAWLGQPVHIGTARARLAPRLGIHHSDVTIGTPASLTLGDVDLSTGLMALLSRRIEHAAVRVSNSRVQMPLQFDMPDSAGAAAPATAAPLSVVSIRAIELRNIVIASRGREIFLSANSSLAGSTLTMSDITASSRGTTISAHGVAQLAPAVDAQIDATAKHLDLDDLMALANAFGGGGDASGGAGSAGRIVARVSADSATAGGLTVPMFSTTARVQGGRASLSPIRFLLFGGRYEGDLDMNLREGTSVTLSSRIRDLDVAQLAAFGGVPDTITGKLSGTGTFSGQGKDLAAALASTRGNGTAAIVNGSIRRLNLVRTVILFFGRPAPNTDPATDAFDRIDARFSLANRVLTADALSLQSRDADIVAQGTLSLAGKELSGHADVSLSEALSAQAGTDLARYTRDGDRIVLPATIGGSLGSPRLSIDAAAAVKRGLRNEVERRLRNLLDRFRRPD
jgi:uncharacterized protein involved in outer membrane biogenesis